MASNLIQEGIRLTLEKRVAPSDLTNNNDTADVAVLPTSGLILFIEKAIASLIAPYLQDEMVSVSSEINIKHFKQVGENELIRCIVHLKYVEETKLIFDIVIFDKNHDEVAIGAHVRYIANKNEFEKPGKYTTIS